MASPNSSWSEITTTALKYRAPKLFDQVTETINIVRQCRKAGNLQVVDGGETISIPLEYDENQTYKRYSGYEVLDIKPSDVFSAAEFEWKQAALSVSISGLEQLKNSGRTRKFNLLKSRLKNGERTFLNSLATDLYSDGTADGGKQIGGLQLLVADTPTNVVGGIDGNVYGWWKNYVDTQTFSSSNIQSYLNTAWTSISRNADVPTDIFCDNGFYNKYLESLQAVQRVDLAANSGDAGIKHLSFNGATLHLDGGYGGSCPTNRLYILNMNYVGLTVHKDRNVTPYGSDRVPVDQDAIVKFMLFAGNMTIANRFLQGVLIHS